MYFSCLNLCHANGRQKRHTNVNATNMSDALKDIPPSYAFSITCISLSDTTIIFSAT